MLHPFKVEFWTRGRAALFAGLLLLTLPPLDASIHYLIGAFFTRTLQLVVVVWLLVAMWQAGRRGVDRVRSHRSGEAA